MNESLKTRLVGAGVLLIGAGLLWPLLFDFDESMQPEPLQLDIPAAGPAVQAATQSATFAAREPAKAETKSAPEPEPAKNSATVAEPVKTEAAAAADPDETVAKRSEKKQATAAKSTEKTAPRIQQHNSTPSLDERGVPVAWVVQVGTFGSWENADKLRNKLVGNKLKAFVDPETSVQTGPYRVQVGPLLTYDDARAANQQIRSDYQLRDTFIRRFNHSS